MAGVILAFYTRLAKGRLGIGTRIIMRRCRGVVSYFSIKLRGQFHLIELGAFLHLGLPEGNSKVLIEG